MKAIRYICILASAFIFTDCALFKPFAGNQVQTDNMFGEGMSSEEESFACIAWRQLFTDPQLQDLIDTALARNLDMNIAGLRVREAEVALKGAKLGFLPSLTFSPSFTILKDQSYGLPLSLDLSNQGLGTIINRKREAQALSIQASDNEQAVCSQLVAAVAKAYSQIQMLDRQMEIMNKTEEVWESVYETQKVLMENGKSYSTSVNQMAAALVDVRIQKADVANQIKTAEYAICRMLGKAPQSIERSKWGAYVLPSDISTGVPANLLDNRADVRAALRSVEAAYYVSRQALGAMFPSLSLSGTLGWTTDGFKLSDPAQMIYNAVASLTQPVFARGQLSTNYKISKLQQEEAARTYAQTVVDAGNEVNEALRACQLAKDKDALYKIEIGYLEDAYSATRELMSNGKASYLEVLTAQDKLLQAELGEAANLYNGAISVINLYASLGGGAK